MKSDSEADKKEGSYTEKQIIYVLKEMLIEGLGLKPGSTEYRAIKSEKFSPGELKGRIIISLKSLKSKEIEARKEVNRLSNLLRINQQLTLSVAGNPLVEGKSISRSRRMPAEERDRLKSLYVETMRLQQARKLEGNQNEK